MKIVQSSHIPHIQFLLLLTSYISIFVTINEQILMYYYLLKSTLYSYFLVFTQCPLILFHGPIHNPTLHLFSHYIFLVSSWLCQLLRASLFLTILTILTTGWVFCKMSLYWDASDIFLIIRLEYRVFGGRPQSIYQKSILST